MRVIRSHVIVLISSSQNELQHPELMEELPELCIHSKAPQTRGKDLAEVGASAWKLCVRKVWVPGAFHGSVYVTGTTGRAAVLGPSRINENQKVRGVYHFRTTCDFGG